MTKGLFFAERKEKVVSLFPKDRADWALTFAFLAAVFALLGLLQSRYGTQDVKVVGSAQPDNVVVGEPAGATFAVTNDPDFLDQIPVTCSGRYQGPGDLEVDDKLELDFGQRGILDIIADVPGEWTFDLTCTNPLGDTLLTDSGILNVGVPQG